MGSPPAFRGSDIPGADLELLLLKYFPKVALFIEKPVSTHSVEKAMFVSNRVLNSGIVCSVGYASLIFKAKGLPPFNRL